MRKILLAIALVATLNVHANALECSAPPTTYGEPGVLNRLYHVIDLKGLKGKSVFIRYAQELDNLNALTKGGHGVFSNTPGKEPVYASLDAAMRARDQPTLYIFELELADPVRRGQIKAVYDLKKRKMKSHPLNSCPGSPLLFSKE